MSKLSPGGNILIYSTYLGGTYYDYGHDIAIDDGEASITGATYSSDFPTTLGAYDRIYNGGGDAFVAKFTGGGGNPPNAPTINGPTSGIVGIGYNYIFNAVDPDGDQVRYIIEWGDNTSDTTAFSPSGTDVTVSHTWSSRGTYFIKARAEDVNGLIGPESTLSVTMPTNKAYTHLPFLRFVENHPNLFPILQKIIQRLGLQY